ncbi:hypothetical protein GN956_G19896 [Arapaima gigas]
MWKGYQMSSASWESGKWSCRSKVYWKTSSKEKHREESVGNAERPGLSGELRNTGLCDLEKLLVPRPLPTDERTSHFRKRRGLLREQDVERRGRRSSAGPGQGGRIL